MPAKTRTAALAAVTTAAPTAPKTPPLQGTTVAVSGTFPGRSHAFIQSCVTSLGGSFTRSVTTDTNLLIASQSDYEAKTSKVSQAKSRNVPIVSIEWLEMCDTKKAKVPTALFDFTVQSLSTSAGAATTSPPPPAPPAPPAAAEPEPETKKPARKKRGAAAVEEDTQEAAPKRKKTTKKTEAGDDAAAAPTAPGAKSKVALEDGAAVDGQIAKGRDVVVPVDSHCTLANSAVYICPDTRIIFDAHLNQSNHSKNANKFYRIQLVCAGNEHHVWTRWGRVGEPGQSSLLGDGKLEPAMKIFESKFKDKSGLVWARRDDAPKAGKYAFAQQNYEETEDLQSKLKDVDLLDPSARAAARVAEPPSKLEPAMQDLMRLIFNPRFMNAAMNHMKYDVSRLPLGKLSKSVIIKAYHILKDLVDLVNDHSLAENKHGVSYNDAIEMLSNSYHSYIPHQTQGRSRIPLLNTSQLIQPEITLLDNLVDLKETYDLMARQESTEVAQVNKLDQQFAGLGLSEMSVLNPASEEFKMISAYLTSSRGHTHNCSYTVESIFRIERPGEADRLDGFAVPAAAGSDRRLLWHGSRVTNFGGILSQGLRIAPPEAPVSGYMFGKGIYLADMSSKSAGYTASWISDGTGLLLLCEAELGTPMLELINSDYNAGDRAKKAGSVATWGQGRHGPSKWVDAGCMHPSLKGIKMPDTTSQIGAATSVAGAGLWYNEYICYDISQVRLRYLLRVKM